MMADIQTVTATSNLFEQFVEQVRVNPVEDTTLLYEQQDRDPNIRRAVICEPPTAEELQTFPIEQERNRLAQAMREYMAAPEPDHMLLIPAPPGFGKTWQGVEFCHWLYGTHKRSSLYAGPRTNFFPEIQLTAMEQGQNTNFWYPWKPRQDRPDEPDQHTCQYADDIGKWMAKGFNGMDFCRQVCGWDYINDDCPYHLQKNQKEPIIYGHHHHVVLGHKLASRFSAVVGDENPLSSFVHEWLVPPKNWPAVPVEDPLALVLYDLQKLCEGDQMLHGETLYNALGAKRVYEACDGFMVPANDLIMAPHLNSSGDVENAPYNLLPTLIPMLQREAQSTLAEAPYPHRIYVDQNGLRILTRRYVNPDMPQHMIWFDATGKTELYEAMFDRPVETVDLRPAMSGKIYQIVDRSNGKSSMIDKDGAQTDKVAQTKTQIEHIISGYDNPAVITYQSLEDELGGDISTLHFYGARGSNVLVDCDVLVVAGTPMPPLVHIEKMAKCLWPSRMMPFDTEWKSNYRRYNYIDADGHGLEYPVSEFKDADLQTLTWQFREAEIIQCLHRARILTRDVPVYLLSNVPIDELPPTRIMTIRELLGAPEGVNVWKWVDVLELAEMMCDEKGVVLAMDLQDQLGLDIKTARKYIDKLLEMDDWEVPEGAQKKRGRPPKSATRAENPL